MVGHQKLPPGSCSKSQKVREGVELGLHESEPFRTPFINNRLRSTLREIASPETVHEVSYVYNAITCPYTVRTPTDLARGGPVHANSLQDLGKYGSSGCGSSDKARQGGKGWVFRLSRLNQWVDQQLDSGAAVRQTKERVVGAADA